MKQVLLLLYLVLLAHHVVYSEVTEEQLNATKKMIRNTCQTEIKPTDDQVDGLQKGNFIQDKNLQIKKDNSFDWENGIAALEANAPPNIAGPGGKTVANCKDAVKTTDDKCVAAYEIAKCIYDDNPSNYFLP